MGDFLGFGDDCSLKYPDPTNRSRQKEKTALKVLHHTFMLHLIIYVFLTNGDITQVLPNHISKL